MPSRDVEPVGWITLSTTGTRDSISIESSAGLSPDSQIIFSQIRYIVSLLSNVPRVNFAWDHSRMAAAIDKAVKTRTAVTVKENAGEAELKGAGEG